MLLLASHPLTKHELLQPFLPLLLRLHVTHGPTLLDPAAQAHYDKDCTVFAGRLDCLHILLHSIPSRGSHSNVSPCSHLVNARSLKPYFSHTKRPPAAIHVLASNTLRAPCRYAISKTALVALTKALAEELGPDGIRVNCVAPGERLPCSAPAFLCLSMQLEQGL